MQVDLQRTAQEWGEAVPVSGPANLLVERKQASCVETADTHTARHTREASARRALCESEKRPSIFEYSYLPISHFVKYKR